MPDWRRSRVELGPFSGIEGVCGQTPSLIGLLRGKHFSDAKRASACCRSLGLSLRAFKTVCVLLGFLACGLVRSVQVTVQVEVFRKLRLACLRGGQFQRRASVRE